MSVSSLPTTKDIEPVILEILSDREIHELQDIVAECANRFNLTKKVLREVYCHRKFGPLSISNSRSYSLKTHQKTDCPCPNFSLVMRALRMRWTRLASISQCLQVIAKVRIVRGNLRKE